VKRTEFQSTRKTSPCAVSATRFASWGAASPYAWKLVALLSLGGCFEIYNLALTATLSPGLIRSGIFHEGSRGLFGLTDQASFAAATFAGLFAGSAVLGGWADRFGRRTIFIFSMLWYSVTTLGMALQHSAVAIDSWRFFTGIGLGLELVTIDTYIAELIPARVRGRAFAINQCIQLIAIPVATFVSWLLLPRDLVGVAGWRWVAVVGAVGALVAYYIRRQVPESPQWLLQRGRLEEARAVLEKIEPNANLVVDRPQDTGSPGHDVPAYTSFSSLFGSPHLRRTLVLIVLNIFQASGFYGLVNWLPTLLISRGFTVLRSLRYTFIISIVYPLSPLLFVPIADKIERKWHIVLAAGSAAVLGLLFWRPAGSLMLVTVGILLTISNNWLSFAYHAYQAEMYPTSLRGRGVGFVYSFSRLSTVVSSFLIAFLLRRFGPFGVFGFIACSMAIVVVTVGFFGPRTRATARQE
jgi:MFS transporter, putative metabolite:H+ symporter